MRILTVIPMYGKAEYTDKCIELTMKYSGIDTDILVVDDGSAEKYLWFGEGHVDIIRLEKNSGFTNASNQGILYAQKLGYDYVQLLNNDIEPYPDFIKNLHKFMEEHTEVGIAGSVRILETDMKHNVELFGADLIRGHQQMTDMDTIRQHTHIFVHWVPLCSALIRMDMLREIGILDKKMRTWCSDADLCFRANFAGWNVALVPSSVVHHHHQVTTGKNIEEGVMADQKVALEKMAGVPYAKLMNELPLDCAQKTYGQITFEVVKR